MRVNQIAPGVEVKRGNSSYSRPPPTDSRHAVVIWPPHRCQRAERAVAAVRRQEGKPQLRQMTPCLHETGKFEIAQDVTTDY